MPVFGESRTFCSYIPSFVWGSADMKDSVVFLYRESVGVKFPDLTEGGFLKEYVKNWEIKIRAQRARIWFIPEREGFLHSL
jgi:hypothetical protein